MWLYFWYMRTNVLHFLCNKMEDMPFHSDYLFLRCWFLYPPRVHWSTSDFCWLITSHVSWNFLIWQCNDTMQMRTAAYEPNHWGSLSLAKTIHNTRRIHTPELWTNNKFLLVFRFVHGEQDFLHKFEGEIFITFLHCNDVITIFILSTKMTSKSKFQSQTKSTKPTHHLA